MLKRPKNVRFKLFVELYGQLFECDLREQSLYFKDDAEEVENALIMYVLHTCTNEEILLELANQEPEFKIDLAYNTNLSCETADKLADEINIILPDGRYLKEYYVLLGNPCLSGKKLDELARMHLKNYCSGSTEWYKDSEMLMAIAKNPSTLDSTLEMLRKSKINKVVYAAQRE